MKKEDIKRERYLVDPFDIKKLESLKQYEEIAKVPMVVKGENLYTYLLLAYDINSDIIKEHPIRGQQKYEAARLAGFKIQNNQFDKNIEEYFVNEVYDFNKAIAKFVSLFGSPEWILWNIHSKNLENEFYNALKGDTKKQSTENAIKIGEEIKNIQKSLFYEDDTKSLRKALYDFIAKPDNLMPTVENMVDMLEQFQSPLELQKEVLGEVMGEGYNPTTQKDYLHFKGDK